VRERVHHGPQRAAGDGEPAEHHGDEDNKTDYWEHRAFAASDTLD